ncbi:dicarboxylate/amino acid:cation symporter [Sulfuriflexus mobilis]|uniref:dicarboxylate/amino acid:cation symporter n=1 Tax=Sulfuriflexus mobilis TaxID=1811807 RepID=UPI000F82178C|nr:dicarboxylate/amino acid:cation symporter [Sulfuriflexus mobilis]
MIIKYLSANNPFNYLSSHLTRLVKGRLWLKVLIGMVLGIGVGMLIGPTTGWLPADTATTVGNWLALPGQLFLTLIQMIVIPLIFASVVRGLTASGSFEQLRKMGVGVVVYFVITTTIAIIIGLGVAQLINPGSFVEANSLKVVAQTGAISDAITQAEVPSMSDLPQKLMTILPTNPLTSMVEGQMLQVVIFAVIMGAALVIMNAAQSKPLLDLMASLQEVCMTVVGWAMRLAPLAVFGLMAQLTTKIGLNAILGMGVYVGTVLLGLLILMLLYLTLIYFIARESPFKFIRSIRDVLLLAFSTSSSAAVMPLSIKTAEENLKIHSSVSQFVIPLGATINMNGTALYQGVATLFLAQVFGVDLSMGALILVIVTAVGASIGSPGTPGVGIIILAIVLETAGIPPAGIVLIMGVDRILDMSRTAVNVCGDLVAAKLMNRWMMKTEMLDMPAPEAAS